MKSLVPRYAGVIAAVVALCLIAGIFVVFGTVDLVFIKDGHEVGRQENVTVFTDIELDPANTYYYNGVEINEDQSSVKWAIPIRLFSNVFSFNFDKESNDIAIGVE